MPAAPSAHDFMQPLNVIQLACGNIRARSMSLLDQSDADYLEGKIERIEQQVARLAELADELRRSPSQA